MPFTGQLAVENEDFELFADRIIVRASEIAFVLSGPDEGGFTIEGTATISPAGFFMAARIPIQYQQFAGDNVASVRFDNVTPSPNGKRCSVRGCWIEGEDSWIFEGNLNALP